MKGILVMFEDKETGAVLVVVVVGQAKINSQKKEKKTGVAKGDEVMG